MYDPAEGFPTVVVELAYDDVSEAVDWLSATFGFREVLRQSLASEKVVHADMDTGHGGVIMMTRAGDMLSGPRGHADKQLIVFVDDVDGHHERARRAGANILRKPETKPWGLRQYLVEDLAGHRFEFTQFIRAVPPEDWGAVVK
jgi:uncharacterized glyoxalase superfamily protein PhnB